MRKFKTTKIDEEAFNKKFEKDLNEIKEKIHAEKTSDEFKQNLQNILEEELNKTSSKNERKIHFPVAMRKLAFACACLIVIFSSCITFADDIENVIFKIFGNTDKVVEEAIANGNYKKIDMEYVEDNGVSIKVDYIIIEDNHMYVAFNVFRNEIYDEIYIKNIEIKDQDDALIYSNNSGIYGLTMTFKEENLNSNNSIVSFDFKNNDYKFNELTKIKFKCDLVNIIIDKENRNQTGIWEFEIKIK